MSGFGFGKGPPLTAEHQAVHEIRADETLALRARIAELEAELTSEQDRADRIARELDALRWGQEASAEYTKQMRKALKDTTVCLVAAVSLLESGGKKAAPSNKMFEQMLDDYKNSIERGRAALGEKE